MRIAWECKAYKIVSRGRNRKESDGRLWRVRKIKSHRAFEKFWKARSVIRGCQLKMVIIIITGLWILSIRQRSKLWLIALWEEALNRLSKSSNMMCWTQRPYSTTIVQPIWQTKINVTIEAWWGRKTRAWMLCTPIEGKKCQISLRTAVSKIVRIPALTRTH